MKLKSTLLSSVCACGLRGVFANTNSGAKLYVCATAQNDDLTQVEYEALTWVQVKGVGSHGETGTNTNIVSYDTWDTIFTQKAKGISDAGSPEIELANIPADAGQVIMKTGGSGLNPNNYAFKIVKNDAPAGVGSVGTTFYNRGIIAGPRTPNGRNEDFDLRVYTLGLQQEQIEVAAHTAP